MEAPRRAIRFRDHTGQLCLYKVPSPVPNWLVRIHFPAGKTKRSAYWVVTTHEREDFWQCRKDSYKYMPTFLPIIVSLNAIHIYPLNYLKRVDFIFLTLSSCWFGAYLWVVPKCWIELIRLLGNWAPLFVCFKAKISLLLKFGNSTYHKNH